MEGLNCFLNNKENSKSHAAKEFWVFIMPATICILIIIGLISFVAFDANGFINSKRDSTNKILKSQKDTTNKHNREYLEKVNQYKEQHKVNRDEGLLAYQLMVDMQTAYEHRLDNVQADLRQAHNDFIDNLTIHVSFWICLLALLGGVVPLFFNLGLRKQMFSVLHDSEKKMEILLEYASLRSEEEKFYIVAQNIQSLSLMGRIFFNSDIHRLVKEQYDLIIKSNNKIISSCEKLMNLENECKSKSKNVSGKKFITKPDFQLYCTSLFLLVQNLQVVYSTHDELIILDSIKETIGEFRKENIKLEDQCRLSQDISGLFSLLRKKSNDN